MSFLKKAAVLISATAFTFCTFSASAHEEQVILVGRNAAGQLKVDLDFSQPVELPASIFPGISGYTTGELALHSTILDEPNKDFFQLSTDADFRFVLLAKDPGMEVLNDTGSGFMEIGERFSIGPSPFDTHPIWNLINPTQGSSSSLTLKLIDLNEVYPESEPFSLSFIPLILYRLSITSVNSQSIVLSWPTNAVDWELESANSTTSTNWDVVTNAVEIIGTNFTISISTIETQKFFRLRKE